MLININSIKESGGVWNGNKYVKHHVNQLICIMNKQQRDYNVSHVVHISKLINQNMNV